MFTARYRGRCAGCDEEIEPGQSVAYVDDDLVHAGCGTGGYAKPGSKKEEVCTTCWLIKPCECEVGN